MPEIKHNFIKGRMNKDLDERLVPNGEYRDALNIEVVNSEGSDMGSVQTTMGNVLKFGGPAVPGGVCVGSIANEKEDKIYWLIAGNGVDAIAEYDASAASPVINTVMVDMWGTSGIPRVLNFDKDRLITGINIIPASDESEAEGILFWTDNFSEPKRINIERSKMGSTTWNVHTNFMVRDTSPGSLPNTYVVSGPVEEAHITVIRQGPPTAPVLEMRSSKEDEITEAEINSSSGNPFLNPDGELETSADIDITFVGCPTTCPGFDTLDHLIISCPDDPATEQINESDKKIRVIIKGIDTTVSPWIYSVRVLSGDPSIKPDQDTFHVELEKIDPLFQFKFPRFAYRYKYEDGEYSPFSPFTQVAFLPDDFYYLPKEGYNLGMVNQLRNLAIKDFVHPRLLPDDVISVDILYKESNSPNVYSVKTIKRKIFVGGVWDEWNAVTDSISQQSGVRGFLKITSELIHATLPSNQLLRPWDNVPRKALAQEISGNRLIYGNYLQNYDLHNEYAGEKDIEVKVNVNVNSEKIADNSLNPAQKDPWFITRADNQYLPAKSVKTLRTYQVGVVYIDEYGRETPVFSNDKSGGPTDTSTATVYIDKLMADQANSLKVNIKSTVPEWAKAFKYFIKETSNEYYNLAMDRWYDAEDGNIWMSFPSSERNKVDIDTFLILKKEHDDNIFVDSPARYKILAIDNEAPTFIKQENLSMGIFIDNTNGDLIGPGGIGFPLPQRREIKLDGSTFENLGWDDTVMGSDDIHTMYLRIKSSATRTNWYQISSVAPTTNTNPDYTIKTKKLFGDDMSITSANNSYGSKYGSLELEIVNRKPTHRAEFDGRFFVKVLKDLTFINRIIKPKTGEEEYISRYSKKVQYINPQSPHAAGDPIEKWSGFGCNKNGISYDSDNHGQNDWGWNPSSACGDDYWGWAGISKKDDHDSEGWFIDKVEAFRRFKFTKKQHNISDQDDGYRTRPDSSTAARDHVNLIYGRSYTDPKPSIQSLMTHTGGVAYPSSSYKDLMNYTASDGGNIVPSVGIDRSDSDVGDTAFSTNCPTCTGSEDIIHLSFAGYGNSHGLNVDPDTWGETKLDLSVWSDYAADIIFGNEVSTPGTLWKWKEDPDQIIYKTVQYSGTAQTSTEFADNFNDTWGTERGVGLYNYVSLTDYIKFPHHYVESNGTGITYKVSFWASCKRNNHGSWTAVQEAAGPFGGMNWYWLGAGGGGYESAAGYGAINDNSLFPPLIEDWREGRVKRRRFQFAAKQADVLKQDPTLGLGAGPSRYLPTNDPTYDSYFNNDYTLIDPITGVHPVTSVTPPFPDPAPGIRFDGMWSGMNAAHPANNGPEIPNTKTWNVDPNTGQSRAPGSVTWQIMEQFTADTEAFSSVHPAIWETEPKEDVGLDIYHEVGQIYPVELNENTIEQHVGPVHQTTSLIPDGIIRNSYVKCWRPGTGLIVLRALFPLPPNDINNTNVRVFSVVDGDGVQLASVDGMSLDTTIGPFVGDKLIFVRSNGGETEAEVTSIDMAWPNGPKYNFKPIVHGNPVTLPWHNCYSFGNGVESDRVRDDYNQVTIDNGPKASTTLEEPYLEERRCSGLIYSGIYNSLSGINNLNQFIQAEKITKDLNPSYGCIQKLHSRNTDLITLCEDKVLTVLANKDAMFNADGNVNVTSNLNVLGQAMPTSKAEYGISKNPESFASQADRIYFADKSRGAVLRLGQDGLTAISSVGMKDYFSDNLVNASRIIGSFDDRKGSYNITFDNTSSVYGFTTLSYTENARGWTSFKSFNQESGLSLNSGYYTFRNGGLWEHHVNLVRNSFYGNSSFNSSIKFLFNDAPGSVKSFNTLNYEGSQARITQNLNDPDYYNNVAKDGWYVDMIETNLQTGDNLEFKDKEGKWFSTIKGETTSLSNLDEREFSVQGIGNASAIDCPSCTTPSWNCISLAGGGGSCTDPGTGLGQYTTLAACQANCFASSWDCDGFGNCIDPGTGLGAYSSLIACQAVCACPPLLGPAGPDYFLTVQNDTGLCASPNNDGSVTWSLTIPNFIVGDQWTHMIKTSSGGQVTMPTTLFVANGGGTVTSLSPDTYHLYIAHASSGVAIPSGGNSICNYTIIFTVGCGQAAVPSWDCDAGSCGDPGNGLGFYSSLAACQSACFVPSWDCNTVTGVCSDPGTGLGAYPTQTLCEDFCDTWDCIQITGGSTGNCVNPGNGLGYYGSLADCQNVITGCPSQRWACCDELDPNTGLPYATYDPTCDPDPDCTCDSSLCAGAVSGVTWSGCIDPCSMEYQDGLNGITHPNYLMPNNLPCHLDPSCTGHLSNLSNTPWGSGPCPVPGYPCNSVAGSVSGYSNYWCTMPPCSPTCFVAGTKVTMEDDSYTNIEDIKIGDIVKSWNEDTGDINSSKVTKLLPSSHDDMIMLNFGDIEIKNTFDHPYYVEGKGWCSYKPELTIAKHGIEKVKQLEVNDICYKYSNGTMDKITLNKIEEDLGEVQTYIFELEKDNTFFANNILVHNKRVVEPE